MPPQLNSWGGLSSGLKDNDDTRSLLNPSLLFVDGNYALRLNAWCSVAGVTLGLRSRFMRAADGEVVDSADQLIPTGNRVLTTTDVSLSIGWPLTIELFALAGTPTIGQCFVQVQIVRGRGAASTVFATILQGYITATNNLAWPGSPLEKALDGAGALRSIAGTNPGAGAEITETVPAGARWTLHSFRTRLTASATVANRFPRLTLDDGGAVPYAELSPLATALTAGQAAPYVWGEGLPTINGQVIFQAALPNDNRLGPAHRIKTVTTGIQVGDVYDQIQYLVREWLTAD